MLLDKLFKNKEAKLASLSNELFICFDLETTGLSAMENEIIEIGATFFRIKNETVYNLGSFNNFVKPTVPIPNKITGITGITDSMVEQADDLKTTMLRFRNYIESIIADPQNDDITRVSFVAQNAKFDIKFLTKAMLDTDVFILSDRIYDTRVMSKHIHPEESKHDLKTLCDRYNVSYDSDSHHRADYDADITTKVFTSQILLKFLDFNLDKTIVENGNGVSGAQIVYLKELMNIVDCSEDLSNIMLYQTFQFINSLNISTIIEYLKKKV